MVQNAMPGPFDDLAGTPGLTRPSALPATHGIAPVKAAYMLPRSAAHPLTIDDDAAESRSNPVADSTIVGSGDMDGKNVKRQRTGLDGRRAAGKGANKGKERHMAVVRDEVQLCQALAIGQTCPASQVAEDGTPSNSTCKRSHDVQAYLKSKEPDIHPPLPGLEAIQESSEPFYAEQDVTSIRCPVFDAHGVCSFGLRCRFLAAHVENVSEGQGIAGSSLRLVQRDGAQHPSRPGISFDALRELRSHKGQLLKSDAYIKEVAAFEKSVVAQEKANRMAKQAAFASISEHVGQGEQVVDVDPVPMSSPPATLQDVPTHMSAEQDTPLVSLRSIEKPRMNWRDQLYLAPLTTTGNLPFRQLCVQQGADITCAEMGLASALLSGNAQEWGLARRGAGEKIFGIQIAGSKYSQVVPATEALAQQASALGGVDFIDLNIGCPIDLVCNTGAGSMLLEAPGRLAKLVIGMNRVSGDIPITMKMRMAVNDKKMLAHALMPRAVREWCPAAMTLHGRTKRQRYSKNADWSYIKQCVEAVRATEADLGLPHTPIIGNGDCFSAGAYYESLEESGVDCVMIARGALIKPWIFREIKERREIDISARERLDLIGQYAELGLQHWGSDTMGVNQTRRFLCEALSFQYRYVPIGILEHIPSRINDRPPPFQGRNELETLLASSDSRDWVKISELFLGKAPEQFKFIPKHKSNAYGDEAGADEG